MSTRTPATDSHRFFPRPFAGTMRRSNWPLVRWFTLGAISWGLIFSLKGHPLLPGLPILGALLAAYVGLVRFQYRHHDSECGGPLGMRPSWYFVLSILLIFGLIVSAGAATNGGSLWYAIAYFMVVGESGNYLDSARALVALMFACMALVTLSILVLVSSSLWPMLLVQFLPFDAGLGAAAMSAWMQRAREREHAARLAALEELERSKAELEDANRQLQVYAGTVEQLAVANERNRMARELHDILGYTLATVVVKAEAARRLLAADPARAREELDRVQEVARGGLAEVRRSVSGLRDGVAAPGVWREAIERFVEDFGRANGIAVRHSLAALPAGHDSDLEICLFRVLQEALTNVARHAQARQVAITLDVQDERLALRIEDDGVGAGPDGPSGGFGLRGMRERVELLGGALVFSSRRGAGTRVLATLPIRPAADPALAARCDPTGACALPAPAEARAGTEAR